MLRAFMLAGLALLAAACGAEAPEAPPPDTTAAAVPMPTPTPAPARPDTIFVEGMPTPIATVAYTTPEGFPLAFTTRHPDDLAVQELSSGEGDAVRFTANFGGPMDEQAVLNVFVFPGGTREEVARVRVRELAALEARVAERQRQFAWSLLELAFTGEAFSGYYALGEHAGRYFYVMAAHPPEYGDGFGPRVQYVLDHWRWLDTGDPLGGAR